MPVAVEGVLIKRTHMPLWPHRTGMPPSSLSTAGVVAHRGHAAGDRAAPAAVAYRLLNHGVVQWAVTTRLAYSLLDAGGRLKSGRLVDAAVRGALLIDLAAAGMVSERDGGLRLGAAQTGFAPADQLLADVAGMRFPTVRGVVCRGGVSRQHVARELVARRVWAAQGRRSILHPRSRYEVMHRLPEPSRDDPTDVTVDLMLWLFEPELDDEDFDRNVTAVVEQTANRLTGQVLAELVDLRSWLAVEPIGNGGDGAGT